MRFAPSTGPAAGPRRPAALLAALLCCTTLASAQVAPIRWGDIPEKHLAMTSYAEDTNAVAVILGDYGEVSFRESGEVELVRHRRIKILSEAAYDDWGTFAITFLSTNRQQRVDRIKGQTFVPGPGGKAQRHKMDKKAVFKEHIDGDWERIRFTLPALTPGAVIEYQYRVVYKSPVFLPSWQFQKEEPTLVSEYRAEIPELLQYVFVTRGFLDFDMQEEEHLNRPGGDQTRYRWVMRDVPALREEPYMTNPDDYRARLEVQLAAYYYPGQGMVRHLSSWPNLAGELMGSSFGRQLDPNRAIRGAVPPLVADAEQPHDKMVALYDHLRTTVNWDGSYGFFPSDDLHKVLDTKSGDVAEINLLLVAMLRAAGLEAHPVLLSTRRHGQVLEIYPLLQQFNYVVAHVRVGGDTFLLDATDPHRPYHLLPTHALNGRGWMVKENGAAWIPVVAGGQHKHLVRLTAELGADGTLSGTISGTDDAYSALVMRHLLEDAAPEDLVRDVLMSDLEEVTLEAVTIENQGAVTEPLRTEARFTVPRYAQVAGDRIYLNPLLVGRLHENPLRLPDRKFPVDFTHPFVQDYQLELTLPEGYVLEEAPASRRISIGSRGKFTRMVEQREDRLGINVHFGIAQAVFPAARYQELQQFYNEVVAAQAEVIVLKRADDAGGSPEGLPR